MLRRRPVVVALLAALFLASATPVFTEPWNRDVSWLLYIGGRLARGATLGVDYFENTPPLIVWISAPVAWLAHRIGVSPEIVMHALTYALVAGAVIGVARALPGDLDARLRSVILLAVAAALLLGPGVEFSQREHLFVVLGFAYVVLAARRLEGGDADPTIAAVVGAAAAVGSSLKPHFLILVALLEIRLVMARGSRRFRDPEFIALTATGLAYAVSLPLFARAWLVSLPHIIGAYGYREPLSFLVVRASFVLPLLALALGLAVRRESATAALRTVLVLATASGLLSALAQGKGLTYHYYPAVAFSYPLLALTVWDAAARVRPERRRLMVLDVGALVLALGVAVAVWAQLGRLSGVARAAETTYTRDMARQLREGESLFAFSTATHAAFPLVDVRHLRWQVPFYGLWYLQGFYRSEDFSASPEAFRRPRDMSREEAWFFERTVKALIRASPDVLIVDEAQVPFGLGRPFDFLGYFEQDPAFSRWIKGYGTVATVGGCRVLRRGAARRRTERVFRPSPYACLPRIEGRTYPEMLDPRLLVGYTRNGYTRR